MGSNALNEVRERSTPLLTVCRGKSVVVAGGSWKIHVFTQTSFFFSMLHPLRGHWKNYMLYLRVWRSYEKKFSDGTPPKFFLKFFWNFQPPQKWGKNEKKNFKKLSYVHPRTTYNLWKFQKFPLTPSENIANWIFSI